MQTFKGRWVKESGLSVHTSDFIYFLFAHSIKQFEHRQHPFCNLRCLLSLSSVIQEPLPQLDRIEKPAYTTTTQPIQTMFCPNQSYTSENYYRVKLSNGEAKPSQIPLKMSRKHTPTTQISMIKINIGSIVILCIRQTIIIIHNLQLSIFVLHKYSDRQYKIRWQMLNIDLIINIDNTKDLLIGLGVSALYEEHLFLQGLGTRM